MGIFGKKRTLSSNTEQADRDLRRTCDSCSRYGNGYKVTCGIYVRAMTLPVEDDNYPTEWGYTIDGKPDCSQWSPK